MYKRYDDPGVFDADMGVSGRYESQVGAGRESDEEPEHYSEEDDLTVAEAEDRIQAMVSSFRRANQMGIANAIRWIRRHTEFTAQQQHPPVNRIPTGRSPCEPSVPRSVHFPHGTNFENYLTRGMMSTNDKERMTTEQNQGYHVNDTTCNPLVDPGTSAPVVRANPVSQPGPRRQGVEDIVTQSQDVYPQWNLNRMYIPRSNSGNTASDRRPGFYQQNDYGRPPQAQLHGNASRANRGLPPHPEEKPYQPGEFEYKSRRYTDVQYQEEYYDDSYNEPDLDTGGGILTPEQALFLKQRGKPTKCWQKWLGRWKK